MGIPALTGAVSNLFSAGALDEGNATALLATLDNAQESIAKDRPNAANLLDAFINQVEGFVRGANLTTEQGEALIAAARAVIDRL